MLIQNPLNESASAFPILECMHIAGIVCGLGTAALVNVRLLGAGLNQSGLKRSTPAQLWRDTMPWTLIGLTIAILSGLLLFSIDPEKYLSNNAFRAKIVILLIAIAFYYTLVRRAAVAGRGASARAPRLYGRGGAALSLALWVAVPFGGVFIGFIDSITNLRSYTYPVVLWLHIVAMAILGGLVVVTDLRLLDAGMQSYSLVDLVNGLRVPKRWAFLIAAGTGVILFADKAGHLADVYDRWLWIKLALLVLIGANYLAFRRGVFAGTAPDRAKLAAGLSLFLCAGVIGAARGPATIKDIMHSMVDPSGDYLFQSVQTIADEHGLREKAPQTQAQWDDVRERVMVLLEAPELLAAPGRMAAEPKDRSKNPAVEDEPWEVQELLDAQHPEFVRRAQRLHEAASEAMKAVEAKDKDALLVSLDGIDKACESCHLHFWYPRDQRAREAAKLDGVID